MGDQQEKDENGKVSLALPLPRSVKVKPLSGRNVSCLNLITRRSRRMPDEYDSPSEDSGAVSFAGMADALAGGAAAGV